MSDVIIVLVMLAIGMSFGRWLEARRWRKNADDYIRIESGGKLYKVEHA